MVFVFFCSSNFDCHTKYSKGWTSSKHYQMVPYPLVCPCSGTNGVPSGNDCMYISAKMHYENKDISVHNSVQISAFLWYMLFGALIVPLAGIFTFAISNFYSVQVYPIGYFLDKLHSVIRRGGCEEQRAQ